MNQIEKVVAKRMLTAVRKEKAKEYRKIMRLEEELAESKAIYAEMQKFCDEMQEKLEK